MTETSNLQNSQSDNISNASSNENYQELTLQNQFYRQFQEVSTQTSFDDKFEKSAETTQAHQKLVEPSKQKIQSKTEYNPEQRLKLLSKINELENQVKKYSQASNKKGDEYYERIINGMQRDIQDLIFAKQKEDSIHTTAVNLQIFKQFTISIK